MFHNYDPYEELENTKHLAHKLAQAHNQLALQAAEFAEVIEQHSRELKRLKMELNQLKQTRSLRE